MADIEDNMKQFWPIMFVHLFRGMTLYSSDPMSWHHHRQFNDN